MWYTATQHGQQAFKLLAGPQKEFSFQFSLTCVLISFLLFGACLRFWRLDHRLYVKDGCDYHLSWGHLHSVIQSSGLCEDCSRSLMLICIWDHCLGNTQLCPSFIHVLIWGEVEEFVIITSTLCNLSVPLAAKQPLSMMLPPCLTVCIVFLVYSSLCVIMAKQLNRCLTLTIKRLSRRHLARPHEQLWISVELEGVGFVAVIKDAWSTIILSW